MPRRRQKQGRTETSPHAPPGFEGVLWADDIDWTPAPPATISDETTQALATTLPLSVVGPAVRHVNGADGDVWRAARPRSPEKRKKGVEWDAMPLGKESDTEIARSLGVSAVAVRHARKKKGIEAVGPNAGYKIDWDAQPLGNVADSIIAKSLGVSKHVVFCARTKRGIPNYWERFDWDAQPLGKESDGVIAKRLGVSLMTVFKKRRERGIPAHQDQKKSKRPTERNRL